MKKKLLVLLLPLCLTGCTREFDRGDVKDYVNSQLALPRGFTVSREAVTLDGTDGYEDRIWTVRSKDGLEFRVSDDTHWGMEWPENCLTSDYMDALLLELAQAYGGFSQLSVSTDWEDSLLRTRLEGRFSTRRELEALTAELEAFSRFAGPREGSPQNVLLTMDVGVYDAGTESTEVPLYFRALNFTPQDRQEALDRLLAEAVDYRLPILESFSREEILALNRDKIGIARKSEGPYRYYEDLSSEGYISYAMLLELLTREGISVSGSREEFFFQAADGSLCTFSEHFTDADPAWNDGRISWYYLQDGEPRWVGRLPRLSTEEVQDLTGLFLRLGRPEGKHIAGA